VRHAYLPCLHPQPFLFFFCITLKPRVHPKPYARDLGGGEGGSEVRHARVDSPRGVLERVSAVAAVDV